jgi:actin-like ATPase involved in cell morphogenesis
MIMKGCDIGTCFLVSAAQDSGNKIIFKTIRDAFLDMENEPQTKSLLKMSSVDFIEAGEKVYVIGDSAVTMANIFKKEARRPLSRGVIAPGELEAEKILLVLIENILGKAINPGEICFYSVPAAPVDHNIDIVYHQAMFSKLIGSLGYKPVALNEAAAISYSNAAKEQFSSLAISMGAGMINVCLMFKTMIGMAFSIQNSGDWLDESVAKATGSTASRIQTIKEKGVNLMDPNEGDPKTLREREALVIYYKSLILRALDTIKNEFNKHQGSIELPNSVPIILSGGTSLAKGFKDLFEAGFNTVKDKFPIPISEIRMATDPLNAVAQGLLVAAMNYGQSIGK